MISLKAKKQTTLILDFHLVDKHISVVTNRQSCYQFDMLWSNTQRKATGNVPAKNKLTTSLFVTRLKTKYTL